MEPPQCPCVDHTHTHSGCAGGWDGGRAKSNPIGLTQDCYPALRGIALGSLGPQRAQGPHGAHGSPMGHFGADLWPGRLPMGPLGLLWGGIAPNRLHMGALHICWGGIAPSRLNMGPGPRPRAWDQWTRAQGPWDQWIQGSRALGPVDPMAQGPGASGSEGSGPWDQWTGPRALGHWTPACNLFNVDSF